MPPKSVMRLKQRAGRSLDSRLAPRSGAYDPEGIGPSVAGLFGAASGIGESARLCFDALTGLGYTPDAIDLSESFAQADIPTARFSRNTGPNHGPLIIHINPPELPRALRKIGRNRLQGRKIIGYWAWELPQAPPSWTAAMQYVNEVWTPSAFCATALSPGATVPVHVVAHILPKPDTTSPHQALPGIDFHVITTGDVRSSLTRKNLSGAINAFRKAFGNDPGTRLSVRIGHATPKEIAEFQKSFAECDNILLVTEVFDDARESAFIESADVVLSPHRAEGFGLVLAKAMLLGRPVIATDWSGNTEFMTAENACLIGHKLVPVRDAQGIYPYSDQHWAEPNLAEASAWLGQLRNDLELRASIGERARRLYPSEKFKAALRTAIKS